MCQQINKMALFYEYIMLVHEKKHGSFMLTSHDIQVSHWLCNLSVFVVR